MIIRSQANSPCLTHVLPHAPSQMQCSPLLHSVSAEHAFPHLKLYRLMESTSAGWHASGNVWTVLQIEQLRWSCYKITVTMSAIYSSKQV